LAFIVDGGFGTFPIFSESFQARAQISGLDFINAAIMQGNGGIFRSDFSQFFCTANRSTELNFGNSAMISVALMF
jgi:hypothetical protein